MGGLNSDLCSISNTMLYSIQLQWSCTNSTMSTTMTTRYHLLERFIYSNRKRFPWPSTRPAYNTGQARWPRSASYTARSWSVMASCWSGRPVGERRQSGTFYRKLWCCCHLWDFTGMRSPRMWGRQYLMWGVFLGDIHYSFYEAHMFFL